MNRVTRHEPDEHVLLTRAHWLTGTASPHRPRGQRTRGRASSTRLRQLDLRTDPAVADFCELVVLDQRYCPVEHRGWAVVHVNGVPEADNLQQQDCKIPKLKSRSSDPQRKINREREVK
jgi:hypothetical protein